MPNQRSNVILGDRQSLKGAGQNLPLHGVDMFHSMLYKNDFTSQADYAAGDWTEDDLGATPVSQIGASANAANGQLALVNITDNDKGLQAQHVGTQGTFVIPVANKVTAFGCRFAYTGTGSPSEGTFAIGIARTDDSLYSESTHLPTVADYCFFQKKESDSTLQYATDTTTAGAQVTLDMFEITAGTWYDVAFRLDGGSSLAATATAGNASVYYMSSVSGLSGIVPNQRLQSRGEANGIWGKIDDTNDTLAGYVPSVIMCPSVVTIGSSANSQSCSIDYIWVAQER